MLHAAAPSLLQGCAVMAEGLGKLEQYHRCLPYILGICF